MKSQLLVSLSLFLLTGPLHAAEPASLHDARTRWLHGNYEEAQKLYEELAKGEGAKTKTDAIIGLSRVLQSQGHYEKAQALIDSAVIEQPKQANLLARQADLNYSRGHWIEAEKAANAAVDLDKNQFLARWVRGQIYRDRGDLDKADQEFRWFVRTYSERSEKDNDIKNPEELLLVGLAGSENARFNNLSDQYEFILKEVYGDALKYDKDFWPAELEAGLLLLEKYNRGEALAAFDKALNINPNAAEALIGKGRSALSKLDIKDAETFAEQALKVNPHLPEALRLRADLYLSVGNIPAAIKELEEARAVNGVDEETLARIAACYFLLKKEPEFATLAAEVAKNDSKPAVFYFEVAERLEERRWYDDAEKFYKKAADLRPKLPWPRNSLGLLYMRLGRETEAREILNRAIDLDPFNVRVSNSLKVLKHLEKYETLKTAHFELRFDPKNDAVLARYMAGYLEDIYADLARKFNHEPKGLILIELFNNHEMFSGRTIALPDLHTIGACTGKMIAMVSPSGKKISKPFNWGRVLRHEIVHIFNLDQTRFLVPHWFTEGLAVMNEGYPRPQIWNQLLAERVPAGNLMNLDNIDLGFIRPKSPLDWNMAYCQSQIYIQYLVEKYGLEKIGDMLSAFRDGLDTQAALAKVCQVDKATFEKGYRDYIEAVAKTLKTKAGDKPMTFAQLKEAHEKEPDNIDLTARLAESSLKRDKIEARKLAEAVLAVKENHPLASLVKAKLLLNAGDADGARDLLKKAAEQDGSSDPKVLLELGKSYYEQGDLSHALEMFEQGHKAEPYDSQWLVQLVRVYAQLGDKEKQIAALKELVPLDADDLENRKRLARLLLDNGNAAEAEKYARESLEIDIKDKEARATLLKALGQQNKDAELKKFQELLEK
ncbi:MAG TPA: tetratricopeptide repeat protein [Gemmataceae bacterium]|nr:tetratricopeptide repeat protein [Gemmataceae bacterium]